MACSPVCRDRSDWRRSFQNPAAEGLRPLFQARILGKIRLRWGRGMQTVRFIRACKGIAIATVVIAGQSVPDALAADDARPRDIVIAQGGGGGGFERLPPSVAPTPSTIAPTLPRVDFAPNPNVRPTPEDRVPDTTDRVPNPAYTDRNQNSTDEPNRTSDMYFGALAFTADGSYSSAWKMVSQPEAEARVLKQCAKFGRGGCEVVSFSGQQCVALATFIGNYGRRRWSLSFTAGGMTYPAAQNAAMDRCNADERTSGKCQPRTAACADGR
jgi:hypothetical protein